MYITHVHADIYILGQLEPIKAWSKISLTRNIGTNPDDGTWVGPIGGLANSLIGGNSTSKLSACK